MKKISVRINDQSLFNEGFFVVVFFNMVALWSGTIINFCDKCSQISIANRGFFQLFVCVCVLWTWLHQSPQCNWWLCFFFLLLLFQGCIILEINIPIYCGFVCHSLSISTELDQCTSQQQQGWLYAAFIPSNQFFSYILILFWHVQTLHCQYIGILHSNINLDVNDCIPYFHFICHFL